MNIIPAAALRRHIAVLGMTGSGKTTTGKLIIEQVVATGSRVCVLDPIKSDWWGLTSSADGRKPGLPFQILGGPHGHVPLHSRAGGAIAGVVGSGALAHSIIDMADFEPGGLQHFFVEFSRGLMKRMRGVVYLVIEEAHLFAPKERAGIGDENAAIHYAKLLATAGRVKGIRIILLTQRTQALHNALLGSVDTLIALRMTAPADQDPVIKWLKANVADKPLRSRIESSLSSIPTGSGWVCSGEAKVFGMVEFPMPWTYDNTKTPEDGDMQREVRTAPVDTEKLRGMIGEAVKEAEHNDPKMLHKRIRELEQLVGRAQKPAPAPAGPSHAEIEDRVYRHAAAAANAAIKGRLTEAHAVLAPLLGTLDGVRSRINDFCQSLLREPAPLPRLSPAPPAVVVKARGAERELEGHLGRAFPKFEAQDDSGLTKGQHKILNALAWLASLGIAEPPRAQLSAVANYRGGAFTRALGNLKTAGYLTYPSEGCVRLTPRGQEHAVVDGVGTMEERWLLSLQTEGQRKIFNALLQVAGDISREGLSDLADYRGGAFTRALGTLKTMGAVEFPDTGHVSLSRWVRPGII